MRYCERDIGGKIKGLFNLLQPGYAEEEIAQDHPEVVAFLQSRASQSQNSAAVRLQAWKASGHPPTRETIVDLIDLVGLSVE